MKETDKLDEKIMYELDLDARIPASKLAKKLKKSKETINFRINRLLKEKYLDGFYTIVNTSKMGWYYIKIYLRFKGISPEKEEEIIGYIQNQSRLSYLAKTEGYFNLIVIIMVRQPNDMIDFLHPFMKKYGDFIQSKDITTFITAHRLNQKFFTSNATTKDRYFPRSLGFYELDDKDKQILEILSENARIPLTDIAKKIGLNAKVVRYRIKKLERDQIVLGYASSPNFSKLGLQFVQINIALKDPTVMQAVINYFDSTNKCLFVMEMLGKYDMAVEVHVKNYPELKGILDGFRKLFFDSYISYDVITITKQYKIIWNPFK